MTDQIGLFDAPEDLLATLGSKGWPDPQSLPFNASGQSVGRVVLPDLRQSAEPLIITGYASLDRLINYLAELPESCRTVRLLLGSEPYPARRSHISLAAERFPEEVERYWTERGISLMLSGKLLKVIERLKQGRVQARRMDRLRLHAKMYCTEQAVTLGSSNFSDSGLKLQLEANARFLKPDKRFAGAWQLASRYWEEARDYNRQLIDLLERLLMFVDWPEALARACAELLEGEWAEAYTRQQAVGDMSPLWPSQQQGIAQALWLIDNVGSALVADATGAGKTRMGAHLVRASMDKIWSSGRIRKGRAVLVCPPAVVPAWEKEAVYCGLPLSSISHGTLSQPTGRGNELAEATLRDAQILAVDEAHNFLNIKSQRTRLLLQSMADHTILFTATPINKGVTDLLRLVDMLGADNLAPSTLKMFDVLLRKRRVNRSLSDDELDVLRREIQRFTVRRTKTMLNRMVDEAPEQYRDADGKQCRYPQHASRVYKLNEPETDRQIAGKIEELASRLRGLAYLKKPIEMPEALRHKWSEEEYLRARLATASKLPAYLVRATLRSSRAALLEHVRGTKWALEHSRLTDSFAKQESGNAVERLTDMAGKPPENRLSIELPDWLQDPISHKKACHEEEKIYLEIGNLALHLSEGREQAKSDLLEQLLERHGLVLAFDSRPITLAWMQRELKGRGIGVLLATGGNKAGKKQVSEAFERGSSQTGRIALCSDSMSEGVNLQRASCMVHLDMPSVVRVAEQRVGRVDRMDSPHKTIEAWWPQDAPEFALRTDERFIERYETVDALLGSNMPLPENLLKRAETGVIDPLAFAKQLENEEQAGGWDGLEDAFTPVRGLVGEAGLVPPDVYARYRRVTARVLSRVSLVRTGTEWAFFCLRGSTQAAPKWIGFPDSIGEPVSELREVCDLLRARLGPKAPVGRC
jgi:hypothetical protein